MRQIQHFFVDQLLTGKTIHILDRDLLRQMKEVLRFRKGDACVLLDNQGHKASARLAEFHSKEAEFSIEKIHSMPRPERALRLYVAVPKKPATFEWIVEKATELGVTEIIPLDTERTQVHELRKVDRLEAIIKEASEQCERAYLPVLHPIMKFADLLAKAPLGILLAGDAWNYDAPLNRLVPKKTENVNIVIGPEGGLSDVEPKALRKIGFDLFVLGETVLRMETAIIATLSLVQYL